MARTIKKSDMEFGKKLLSGALIAGVGIVIIFLFLLYQTQRMSLNLTQQMVAQRLKDQVQEDVIKYFEDNAVPLGAEILGTKRLKLSDAERDDLIAQIASLIQSDVTDDVYRGVEELTADEIESKILDILNNNATFASYSDEQREIFAKELENIIMKDIGASISDMYTQVTNLNNLYSQLSGVTKNGDTINNSVTNLSDAINNNMKTISDREADLQKQINDVKNLATNNTYATDISSLSARITQLLKMLEDEKSANGTDISGLKSQLQEAQRLLNENQNDTSQALNAIASANTAIQNTERTLGIQISNMNIVTSTMDTMIDKTPTYEWAGGTSAEPDVKLTITIPGDSGADEKTTHANWE